MYAQCMPLKADPSKARSQDAPKEPVLPEAAFLSSTTYTNTFFGFALDLPIASYGHLIRLPLMPERQHALLAVGFQDGDRSGSLTIDAIEPREGLEGFSAKEQQQQLYNRLPSGMPNGTQGDTQSQPQISPQGTLIAPRPQFEPGEFQFPEERFHSSVKHAGGKYTATYWTRIKNFKVGVLIATDDKAFLQKSRQAMAKVDFYCTGDDGTLATKDGTVVTPPGERYDGPTVPTWHADAAIQKSPGLNIPPGEISDGVYRNPALGVQYELPKGWDVLPVHNGGDPPANPESLRAFQFLHACSRTLLRIEQPAVGDAAHGYRPMIIVRALDPACLALSLPTGPSDKKHAEEVAVSLEALSEFGKVAAYDLASASDRLFMVFHGTIGLPAEGGRLPQRMSQAMFATSQKKMLLLWCLMAPTSGDLAAMPIGGIRLDGSEPIELPAARGANK